MTTATQGNAFSVLAVSRNITTFACTPKKDRLMTQLIVTLEEGSFTSNIQKAIEMLKGVIGVSLYEREKENSVPNSRQSTYSPRIQRLRGVGKGITRQQIEEDERLSYLLNK